MKFFSTFTGVGGFEVAIHKIIPDAQCVGYSEIEKNSCMIMQKNYPEAKNYGDITRINPDDLPDFDLLCGGFPCQAFSTAGKRLGFNDTRGTLFYEVARIAKAKRPPILLLENVKGLLNHEEGQTFKVIIATLDELGYDTEWELLNSKYFGVPQNRERVYIIGRLRGQSWTAVFPITRTDDELNEGGQGEEGQGVIHGTLTIGLGRQGTSGEYMSSLERIQKASVRPMHTINKDEYRGNGRRIKEDNEDMFTLTKQDQHGIIVHNLQTRSSDRPSLKLNPKAGGSGHISKENETYCLDTGNTQAIQEGLKIRRLTPIECERLQGFPDNWTKYGINEKGETVEISDNQRYARMGNAITTNVAAAIIKRLRNNNEL